MMLERDERDDRPFFSTGGVSSIKDKGLGLALFLLLASFHLILSVPLTMSCRTWEFNCLVRQSTRVWAETAA